MLFTFTINLGIGSLRCGQLTQHQSSRKVFASYAQGHGARRGGVRWHAICRLPGSMLEQTRAPSILLAEDDPDVAGMLVDLLGAKGYVVRHAAGGAEAEALAANIPPDLVIVDLLLPDANGLVLCAELKERTGVPIIVCSGSKRRDDPVLSLKLGADDFIPKPFSPTELLARIEAVRRRARSPEPAGQAATQSAASAAGDPASAAVDLGELAIDPARCRVTLRGSDLHLTPNEYRLLLALASRPDQVVSRKALTERLWDSDDVYLARNLDVHVSRLRAKLSATGANVPALLTVRGFGYRLASPAEPGAAPAA